MRSGKGGGGEFTLDPMKKVPMEPMEMGSCSGKEPWEPDSNGSIGIQGSRSAPYSWGAGQDRLDRD
jgi:hypothetical protein